MIVPHVGSNGCREPYAHASRSPFVRPPGSCLKYLLQLSSLVLHSTSVKTSSFSLLLACPGTGIWKTLSNQFAYELLLHKIPMISFLALDCRMRGVMDGK